MNAVPPEVAEAGLRAVKTTCEAVNPGLSQLQRQYLMGIQKFILKSNFDLDSMPLIDPDELKTIVVENEFRDRIVRACIVAACIDGTMGEAALEIVDAYTKGLNLDQGPINAAWKLANQNLLLARFAIVRKSLPGVKIKQTVKEAGLLAIVKQFLPLAGIEIPEVTARYLKLEQYPKGTLGREFINYIRKNQFSLPGEKGAGPEIIVLHDCLHILGNYGTSAPEEIEVASFQAGCHFSDPIYGLLFGLAQYHLNIQVAPVAPSQGLQADPEKIIAAFARGSRVNRDMWTDFVPWDNFSKSVDHLRVELGIEPK